MFDVLVMLRMPDKVFSRYGGVKQIRVDEVGDGQRSGSKARVLAVLNSCTVKSAKVHGHGTTTFSHT